MREGFRRPAGVVESRIPRLSNPGADATPSMPGFSWSPAHAARIAAQIARAAGGLELLECNPVLIHRDGAVVVDAVAKEVAT